MKLDPSDYCFKLLASNDTGNYQTVRMTRSNGIDVHKMIVGPYAGGETSFEQYPIYGEFLLSADHGEAIAYIMKGGDVWAYFSNGKWEKLTAETKPSPPPRVPNPSGQQQ